MSTIFAPYHREAYTDNLYNMSSFTMKIDDFVTIKTGRTFKKAIELKENGEYSVVQLRDAKKDVLQIDSLVKVDIESSKIINCLKESDVLVISKGAIKKAIFLDDLPDNVVATQHFLVLSVKPEMPLLPAFLAFYLNSEPVKKWVEAHSSGSYQSSLNRSTLLNLPLSAIDLAQQQMIIEAEQSIKSEISLHQKLITARQNQLEDIATNVWGG